eukprot:680924-Amphidinium_carterae.1
MLLTGLHTGGNLFPGNHFRRAHCLWAWTSEGPPGPFGSSTLEAPPGASAQTSESSASSSGRVGASEHRAIWEEGVSTPFEIRAFLLGPGALPRGLDP